MVLTRNVLFTAGPARSECKSQTVLEVGVEVQLSSVLIFPCAGEAVPTKNMTRGAADLHQTTVTEIMVPISSGVGRGGNSKLVSTTADREEVDTPRRREVLHPAVLNQVTNIMGAKMDENKQDSGPKKKEERSTPSCS